MAYINKIVVNGQEVNANQFEGILDKDGHARFIEGEVEPATLTGVTFTYAKWSLSGTHLMIVLAGYTSGKINQYTALGNIYLDTWIMNKIVKINPNSSIITISKMIGRTTSPDAINDYSCSFDKVNDSTLRIYALEAINSGLAEEYFRVQFDLVIDNA